MPEETPNIEETYLPTAGPIAGIPGSHAPGRYRINWTKRTVTRIEDILAPVESLPALAEPAAEQITAPTEVVEEPAP